MYFPKTQITPNLYSNGNLVYDSTKLPYTGYYFEVSDGRCFTGKEPNESTNLLLIKPKWNDRFSRVLFKVESITKSSQAARPEIEKKKL